MGPAPDPDRMHRVLQWFADIHHMQDDHAFYTHGSWMAHYALSTDDGDDSELEAEIITARRLVQPGDT